MAPSTCFATAPGTSFADLATIIAEARNMASLKDRIQNALDESRMLVLGAQVLIGFQFRSVFEPGFEGLPKSAQYLSIGGLLLLLAVVILLMSPGPYHQIVEGGRDSNRVHRFATRVMDLALLPFACGIAINAFVLTEKVSGRMIGLVSAGATLFFALMFWYGLEFSTRLRDRQQRPQMVTKGESDTAHTMLKDKIKQVLTEARVVIPGAQALLGFQCATVLMDGFDKLPATSKYVHLASLGAITISVVFFMTPAAFHRIVEAGQDTERLHRFSSRMLLAGMIPLAIGIAGALFVVVRKVTGSATGAVICAVITLLVFGTCWFAVPLLARNRAGN